MVERELKGDGGQTSGEQWAVGAMLRGVGWDWGIWGPVDLASGRIEAELAALSGRRPWESRWAA